MKCLYIMWPDCVTNSGFAVAVAGFTVIDHCALSVCRLNYRIYGIVIPGGALGSSGGSGSLAQRATAPKVSFGQKIAMMEYPFFTITTFPPNFLIKLGGAVTARSVKLLDRIHNPGI